MQKKAKEERKKAKEERKKAKEERKKAKEKRKKAKEKRKKAKEKRKKAKEEAKRAAEEEVRRLAEEEAKKKAEEDAQKRAEFQVRWKADSERKAREKAEAKAVVEVMRGQIAQKAGQGKKPKPKVCGMELFSSFLLLIYSFNFSNVGRPVSTRPARRSRGGIPHVTGARGVVTARHVPWPTMCGCRPAIGVKK